MDMNISTHGHQCEVFFTGHFTFADNQKFKDVLAIAEASNVRAFILDFTDVTFIDSAVLGMVMILRNTAITHGQSVTIRGANGQPEKVMRMSQFDAKFTMI